MAQLFSLGVMQILAIIFILLVVWWIAFTLLIIRDYKRRAQLPPPPPVPPEVRQEMLRHSPQWPAWRDFFTRRALLAVIKRPALLFIVPWVYLVYGVLFLFIWPCFPLHRVYFPHLHTRHEDA